jgi:hypothetical protein
VLIKSFKAALDIVTLFYFTYGSHRIKLAKSKKLPTLAWRHRRAQFIAPPRGYSRFLQTAAGLNAAIKENLKYPNFREETTWQH